MFARVICPACQYKDNIPEGDMGKRIVCPNCKSPFLAGRSIAEGEAPVKFQAAAPDGAFNKTMLVGDGEPPIRYNCPRCKKPQEAPASEAGIKKPCSACGQRLQVPAAPPSVTPAASLPNLNKTLLASDDTKPEPPIKYNCPTCKKPLESPASEAGVKKPCPACGQRLQVPAAPPPGAPQPNLNKTILASDEGRAQPFGIHAGHPATPGFTQPGQPVTVPAGQGGFALPASAGKYVIIGGGALFLLALLACVVPAFIRGGKSEDSAALAMMQKELEKLKKEIEDKKVEVDSQKKVEAQIQKRRDDDEKDYKERQRDIDLRRERLAFESDKQKKKELDADIAAEQKRIEQDRKDADAKRDRDLANVSAKLEEATRKLNDANTRTQTIITQPPPVIYHDPWNYRYYRPPWWGY